MPFLGDRRVLRGEISDDRIQLEIHRQLRFSNNREVSKDMKTFAEKAYDLLRQVPAGRVTTYKEIAHALGTKAYRGVGQAMKNNPYAPQVP
jgi:O6-methylguanine-DNA--protein-cysteine methyltransferase